MALNLLVGLHGSGVVRLLSMGGEMPSHDELGILISDEDSDLMEHKYRLNKGGYARRTIYLGKINGKGHRKVIMLHREVLARIAGRELTPKDICDHINRDILDNRRENLRIVSWSGNRQNSSRNVDGSSSYRGVTWVKRYKKWMGQVGFKGKTYFCGYFDSEQKAAEASKTKRQELGFLISEREAE